MKNKNHDNEPLLTPAELAVVLKVNLSWIYTQVRLKKIPFLKFGKYLRFKLSDVLESSTK